MGKLVINQNLVTPEKAEALVSLCPFGAISYEGGKLDISSGCKMCKMCVRKGPAGVVEFVEDEPAAGVDKAQWTGICVYVDHAAGKGSVSHHRHGVCVPPCHTVSLGKAKRRRQRGGAMPCAKAVIFTLRALGKARQATASAERAKGFIAPSQQFMDVALMADVKNNMIARAIKNAVYGN